MIYIKNNKNFTLTNNKFHNFFIKAFGDKNYIKTFWKLLTPSLLWGLITSVVPLLFNLFTGLVFTLPNGQHGSIYVAVNYTYSTFVTFDYISTIIIFSIFAAIGNYTGARKYEALKETLRMGIYSSLIISFVLLLFEQIFAAQFAQKLIYLNSYNDKEVALTVILIRSMSLFCFFFAWGWLYVPALSSISNNKPLYYSAIVGLVFFLITDPSFLYSLKEPFAIAIKHNNLNLLFKIQEKASIGIGLIYLFYFIIQPIYIYLYLKFCLKIQIIMFYLLSPFHFYFYKLKIKNKNAILKENEKNFLNKKFTYSLDYYQEKLKQIKLNDNLEKELLFFNSFKLTKTVLNEVFLLSWGNLLDQTFYNLIAVLHFVYSTNYGGTFPIGLGFHHISNLQGWNLNLSHYAASHYFKLIISNPEMLLIFFFGIWDSFSVLPSYFVALELGKNNKQIAKRNMWICMNWSYLMGALFTIIILIFASFINQYATFPSANGNNWYDIEQNGIIIAQVKYYTLWNNARNMMIIWAFMLFFFTATDMGFYLILSGASKILIIGDALITALFVAISMALYYLHFENMYGYFFIPHLDKVVKYFIYLIIIGTNQASNSINDINKKKRNENSLITKEIPTFMA